MAANFAPILLMAGAAALLLMGKKDDKDEPVDLGTDLPGVEHDDVEGPKFKTDAEKAAEEAAQEAAAAAAGLKDVLDNLQYKHLPASYRLPDGMTHEDLWISDDCQAGAIGRDWKPEFQRRDKPTFTPEVAYTEFGDGKRPDYSGEDGGDQSLAETHMINLINAGIGECEFQFPNPAVLTDVELKNAWTDLRNNKPGLMGVWDHAYQGQVFRRMMEVWGEENPDEYYSYMLGRMVNWAVQLLPGADINDQTNLAYELSVREDLHNLTGDATDTKGGPLAPRAQKLCGKPYGWCGWVVEPGTVAPEVIDPSNPDHDDYKKLWLDLRDTVEDWR